MQADKQARIRARAHQIWLDEGKVEGKDAEHWHRAEREIAAEDAPAAGKRTKSAPEKNDGKNGASGGEKAAAAKPARPRAKPAEQAPEPTIAKKTASGGRKGASTNSGGAANARTRARASAGSDGS